MKRVLLSSMLIVALCLTAFAKKNVVATGKTWTAMGDFKIEVAETPYSLNGEELKTFVISYENSPLKVKVAIDTDKKCNTYIVMSDKLSVQYICNSSYFGVEKIARQYGKAGLNTSENELNREEYLKQRVITREAQSPVENARLIAAYFPTLVKDMNSILAVK
jgi:hypothetical protein